MALFALYVIEDCSDLHILYYEDAACTTFTYSGVVDTLFQCQNEEQIGTYMSSREFLCVAGESVDIPMNSVVSK